MNIAKIFPEDIWKGTFSTFAVLHLINWQMALNNQEVYTFFNTKELKHETTKNNPKKKSSLYFVAREAK